MRGDLPVKILPYLLLLGLSFTLLVVIMFSLQWPILHDSPIMLYLGFLMDRFAEVPYRDFFDMNMPGTHIAFLVIGSLCGYSDFGIRIADVIFLTALLGLTWLWLRPISRKVAWCGSVLWGLAYLRYGPAMSLQREYLILLPILAGILVATRMPRLPEIPRYFLAGLLFGLAATIKPHAVIALPLLIAFEFYGRRRRGTEASPVTRSSMFGIVSSAIAGLLIPFVLLAFYLWSKGALVPFLSMATRYWPLYTHLTGDHRTIFGFERYVYLFKEYRRLGDLGFWLAASALGSFAALYHSALVPTQLRQVRLMIGLAICYSIYPVLSGQFWPYHWLLFLYFIIQLSSLCFVEQQDPEATPKSLFLILVMAATLLLGGLRVPPGFVDQLRGLPIHPPSAERIGEIAAFLRNNLQPQDTVQPLDWTGGAVHAMLLSRARLATRFVYDFHFYHHVSAPFIGTLRAEFLKDLGRVKPRFIVEITGEDKPWVSGRDTTRDFPELRTFLAQNYRIALHSDDYIIYERLHSSS